MEKIKCKECGRTLLLADHVKGEMKCPRCGKINIINYCKEKESSGTTEQRNTCNE